MADTNKLTVNGVEIDTTGMAPELVEKLKAASVLAAKPEAPKSDKAAERRAKEKELRAGKKPDYRSAGVTLKVLKPNPKKPGSNAHAVFAQYEDGMTVKDLLDMGDEGLIDGKDGPVSKSYIGACLMWDDRHGYIELVAPTKGEPAKPVEAAQVKEVAQEAAKVETKQEAPASEQPAAPAQQ